MKVSIIILLYILDQSNKLVPTIHRKLPYPISYPITYKLKDRLPNTYWAPSCKISSNSTQTYQTPIYLSPNWSSTPFEYRLHPNPSRLHTLSSTPISGTSQARIPIP